MRVDLCLDPRPVDHCSRVSHKSTTGTANVFINFGYLLSGRGLHQYRGDSLLNGQYYAF